MTSLKSTGLAHRPLTNFYRAIQRAICGKASTEYMKQYSGDDEYWEQVVAARMGWPGEGTATPDPTAPESEKRRAVHRLQRKLEPA